MLDASGHLYAVPGNDPRVRVLNPDGEFIRYIGSRGTGPGEFSYLCRTGFAGDTLWIQDMFAARTSYFDSAGAHIRTDARRRRRLVCPPGSWRRHRCTSGSQTGGASP